MKISVCMATYNGEKYIKEQLESILFQLGENDEVIISDDGSTDGTFKIIDSFNDKRIKFVFNESERGYTKNFENALVKCTGDVVFLADQDDVWVSNKVERCVKALKNKSFVVSDNKIVDESLSTIKESHFSEFSTEKGFIRNWALPRYVGACMAFRKEVLSKSLPFPPNSNLCAHDYWISLIAELYFNVEKVNEPLILYRRHGSNASSGGNKSKNKLIHKLKVRIYTFYYLILRGLNVF